MKRTRKQRGAASVEMAISMLVIIPLFLYTLFLQDLLKYRLDAQEAVLSTAWDFTNQNYNEALKLFGTTDLPTGGSTVVQKQARLMFCDHESGLDSFQGGGAPDDCTGLIHHVGLTSHACWLGEGQQVTCERPDLSVGKLSAPLYGSYQRQFDPEGGMYACSGREVVQNYLLPKTFMPEYSKDNVSLTKARWGDTQGDMNKGDIHDNAKGGTTGDKGDTYLLEMEHLAIVTDSWAVNTPQEVRPGDKSGGLFYKRMSFVFKSNPLGKPYVVAAKKFRAQLFSNELLNPEYGAFDDPTIPNLSIGPGMPATENIKEESGTSSYFTTPWKDWSSDAYKKTYNNRGSYYMGCKNAESC